MRGAWWCLGLLVACAAPAANGNPESEVTALITDQAQAWNRGDLAGFMAGYANDTTLTYVSGRRVAHGWQALYDRYYATYFAPGETHDSLTFEDVAVRALAPDVALATARFRLSRGDSTMSSGPFTLVLQRRGGRWVIVHDQTASDPIP